MSSMAAKKSLSELLSVEERRILAEELAAVYALGYGRVTIEVRGGKIRFVRSERSRDVQNGNSEKDRIG